LGAFNFACGDKVGKGEEKQDLRDDKYLVLMLTNKRHNEIESFFPVVKELYGPLDTESGRMFAIGVIGPMLLNQSVEQMNEQVNHVFDLAEKHNVPIYFQLDDQNNYTTYFGNAAPKKFWDYPGMCEWVAFPEDGEEWGGQSKGWKIPRFWFNWGSWLAAPAVPNFASPSFRALMGENLKEGFLRPCMERYKKLIAEDKAYLFAGCATGWETHIPDMSASNPLVSITSNPTYLTQTMEDYEKLPYGYGALHALGYNQAKLEAEATAAGKSVALYRNEILFKVIHDYAEFMSKTAFDAGIPRRKVFTHTVGYASHVPSVSCTFTPPVWTAVNDYSIPGYTMSPVTCRYNVKALKTEIAKKDPVNEFAIAEGYAAGLNGAAEATAYFKEMFVENNCRLITAFAFGDDIKTVFLFDRTPEFGYTVAANRWLSGSLEN
jgi:hypothetical protein